MLPVDINDTLFFISVTALITASELLKTTSVEICKSKDDALKMPISDEAKMLLGFMSADPDTEQVRCVVRMLCGECKYDAFDSAVQYAEEQEDGTYILVKSTLTDGILIDLEYTNSIGKVFENLEKDHIFIKGIVTVDKLDERQEFSPFPAAKIGRPINGFGGTHVWKNFSPILINKKVIISRYSKGKNKRTTKVVIATIRIVPSSEWDGFTGDIRNKIDVWPVEIEEPVNVGWDDGMGKPLNNYKEENGERERRLGERLGLEQKNN